MVGGASSETHFVNISHDPLEDTMRRRDRLQTPPRWRGGRPLLLAGALGLFAAWLVSGLSGTSRHRRRHPRRRGRSYMSERGAPSARTRGFSATGPGGSSSRHDFEIDALNP